MDIDNKILSFVRQIICCFDFGLDKDYGLSIIEFWLLCEKGQQDLATSPSFQRKEKRYFITGYMVEVIGGPVS